MAQHVEVKIAARRPPTHLKRGQLYLEVFRDGLRLAWVYRELPNGRTIVGVCGGAHRMSNKLRLLTEEVAPILREWAEAHPEEWAELMGE